METRNTHKAGLLSFGGLAALLIGMFALIWAPLGASAGPAGQAATGTVEPALPYILTAEAGRAASGTATATAGGFFGGPTVTAATVFGSPTATAGTGFGAPATATSIFGSVTPTTGVFANATPTMPTSGSPTATTGAFASPTATAGIFATPSVTATPGLFASPTATTTVAPLTPVATATPTGPSAGMTPVPSNPAAGALGAHIAVQGIGTVQATPDIVNLQVGVEVENNSLSVAQTQVTTQTNAVIQQLTQDGVAQTDIQTAQYNIVPVTNNQPNQTPATTGFRVTHVLQITLHDPQNAGAVIDDVVKAGANSIYGVSFGFSNPDALMQQARQAAMQDAQTKAQQLAQLGGVTLGAPLVIEEGSAAQPPQPLARAAAGSTTAGTQLEAGRQQVQVQLQVIYAIQP